MRNSPWYIVVLLAFIGGVMGYSYFTSEIRIVEVTGKRIEAGRSRYGMSSEVYLIDTDRGGMPILQFPVIGYTFGADKVYAAIRPGMKLRVRIGKWPPSPISGNARRHIMSVD